MSWLHAWLIMNIIYGVNLLGGYDSPMTPMMICTLPLCATDEKVKIFVVFDDQLVITVAYSVTNKGSFTVT